MNLDWLEYYIYLEELRRSGITNMYGASSYLEASFPNLTESKAREILANWMKNYDMIMKYLTIVKNIDFDN